MLNFLASVSTQKLGHPEKIDNLPFYCYILPTVYLELCINLYILVFPSYNVYLSATHILFKRCTKTLVVGV